MPDHTIPLVNPENDPVLIEAGQGLASLNMPPEDTVAWYSPYLRTQQTMETVLKAAFGDRAHQVQKRESFLLREQELGDWNTLSEAEMEKENPRRYIALKQAQDAYNKFYFRSGSQWFTSAQSSFVMRVQVSQRREPRRCSAARHALHLKVFSWFATAPHRVSARCNPACHANDVLQPLCRVV